MRMHSLNAHLGAVDVSITSAKSNLDSRPNFTWLQNDSVKRLTLAHRQASSTSARNVPKPSSGIFAPVFRVAVGDIGERGSKFGSSKFDGSRRD
jgi:hypothetical protein